MRIGQLAVSLAVAIALCLPHSSGAAEPSDDEILQILRARIDTFQQSVGIVVGIVDSSGTRIVGYGPRHAGGADVVNGTAIYEIGSISKVFTSILLADMVHKGEVSLRDPVSAYLPSEVQLPTRSGREISLLDLATHRSGLPRMPEQMQMTEDGGASRFPLSQMYAFLSTTTLSYDIGERYYYSNLAFGLLGQALANRAGSEFETLLLERVCRPLGLTDTRVSLSGEQELRLAGTHNWHHGKTPPLEWDTMAAAGGVRSTAKDLLTFLAANMDLSSALGFPLQMSHLDRREASGSALRMGLGWHILSNHGRELIWHSGATFGNMTFAGFDKETRRGVVVLSNARGIIDDIGIHLLDPDSKLADFKEVVPLPAAVDVPFEKLERYAGEYELGPNSVLNIDAEDGKLYASLNEGLRTDLLAASETEVFSRMSPGVMEFDVDRAGEVDGLTVRVYGYEQEARKLEHYRRPPQRTQVASKGDLARFVGRYRFPDEQVAVVGLADSQLSVSVGGQLRMPLVPTKDGFFAQAAEAELMFVEDEAGHVTEVVVHQEGGHRAPRIGD